MEPVNLSDLVEAVLAFYSNRIQGKHITVERSLTAASAFASRDQVRQVLNNLVANALDALSTSGTLHVRLRTSSFGSRPVARLLVADSGSGIEPEYLRRLFEPFFTTKDTVGTGLALWVAKQIVDAHGGCIHVRSRVGKGTVVVVCWPSTGEERVPQVLAAHSAQQA